ncbi:MAG: SDR family oxidoreductase [Phycisphaeraceae bacterium]|nr:SDR family oxidoreductase [Phycisphaeraceae bacterium]
MITTDIRRPVQWKYQPQALTDKRVLVTGGTTGIGRTTVLLLAKAGARVVFFGRHRDTLNDAISDLVSVADRVVGVLADQAHEQDLARVFEKVDESLGGLDILINNAADAAKSITDMDPVDYRYVIANNLLGYMSCAKLATERFKQHGRGGTIINIGSLSAKARGPDTDVYVATKSAVRGWSDAIGKQLAQDNIRVTLIEPGTVGADFREQSPESEQEDHRKGVLLFTESIAELILYVLIQPQNCLLPLVQIQPLKQLIGGD